jgi:3,4-dihydroxy 2-butanone 4-phosphate synthase/GTP cyclohydrolase II
MMGNASPNSTAPGRCIRGLNDLKDRLAAATRFRTTWDRPFVVLSYAQSVDGSIAGPNREPIRLSGPQSMRLTYSIRALCDTILVGIGTVLTDDPHLSVKQVPGKNPRPIVLDTRLRTPTESRLVQRSDIRPWLVHGPDVSSSRTRTMAAAGAEPVSCAVGADGRIDLAALMHWLAGQGINSLMVEGGAQVITSFIHHRLADVIIVTLSPMFLGGLPAIDTRSASGRVHFDLAEVFYQGSGRDLMVWGRPSWAVE